MIYLDYAASAPPFPQVLSRMSETACQMFGNPGALHTAGAQSRKTLQECRKVLAAEINVRPEEIFFTSGGTEANNWALHLISQNPGKNHIVCYAAEHSSVLEPVRALQQKGYAVTYLRPDSSGFLAPEAVENALRQDSGAICVQAVNNETGVIQDVDSLARIARRHRVRYFCDGVQSFGHVDQNLHKADMISLSAHKFGGPRGIGCLVVRQPYNPLPFHLGGGQEFGKRSGTENLPGIAGMALAARLSRETLALEAQRLKVLRQTLEQGLENICPGLQIAGQAAARSSILSCRFPGIPAEEMVMRLDLQGVCASPGAACAARSHEPSHVLLAMGYTPAEASEFVRFSLGPDTTQDQILQTIHIVEQIIQKRSKSNGT